MNKYIQILSNQKKPLKFIASRLLMKSRMCQLLRINKQGFSLCFYPSALSATLWVDPDDRYAEESFFRSYLKPGDKVIDVGANIGVLTTVASLTVSSQGKVYSIEPHPQIYQYLLGNIALNKLENVETFNCAVGEKSGNIIFSDKSNDSQNQVVKIGHGLTIPMSKLDDLPIPEAKVSLLKIDVEGYEKFVVEGGKRVISKTQCVYFESFEEHYLKFGYKTRDMLELLVNSGFKILKAIDDLTVCSVSGDYVSQECENLIAVRDLNSFLSRTGWIYQD